jgi:metal-responsive CopG/Arc/MetJ family transcriptional regulator
MAKVNVSIPDDLLFDIDAIAEALHSSRSGLVHAATAAYVAHLKGERAHEERRSGIEMAMAGARELAKRVPPGDDTTAIIRRVRDGVSGSVTTNA